MSSTTKTDNGNPAAKLSLRRHFLARYHAGAPPRVFDCCQGSGLLWTELRKTIACQYWGVDLKPRKGRLKIDSVRVLQQGPLPFDVIDIDTYGSPWKHWIALLPNLSGPTSVFLTIGSTMFRGSTDLAVITALGLAPLRDLLPKSFYGKLSEIGLDHCLAVAADHGLTFVESKEAPRCGNARYIGLHLTKKSA